MHPSISIILCTHNPNLDYLDKALLALKNQTFPRDQWELLLIDNASDNPLMNSVDLSWHPLAQCYREEQLGLTSARIKGIQESQADLIIFVDDDNILSENYLKNTLFISKNYPIMGVWGGQVKPLFEAEPPNWTKKYWPNLAIREFNQDQWGNSISRLSFSPCGAGLCLKREVGDKYIEATKDSSSHFLLGRKGKSLSSSEDTLIALMACDLGYGVGLFKDLELHHIIPKSRLEESYLLRLEEGLNFSGTILNRIQDRKFTVTWKTKLRQQIKFLLMHPQDRRFYVAAQKGKKRALEVLKSASK